MHVLIHIDEDGVQGVQRIEGGAIFVEEAIRQADDIVRKILAIVEYEGDIDYEDMTDRDPEGMVGAWLAANERWELWEL